VAASATHMEYMQEQLKLLQGLEGISATHNKRALFPCKEP